MIEDIMIALMLLRERWRELFSGEREQNRKAANDPY